MVNSETLGLAVNLRCRYICVRVRKMYLKMQGFLMGLEGEKKFHRAQNAASRIIKYLMDGQWAIDEERQSKKLCHASESLRL